MIRILCRVVLVFTRNLQVASLHLESAWAQGASLCGGDQIRDRCSSVNADRGDGASPGSLLRSSQRQ